MKTVDPIPTGWPVRQRIYLMRHGDVTYFDDQGRPHRPDTVPLNAEGKHQAELAARELADVAFDLVLSSDLPRSVETASIVAQGRAASVQTHAELREIQPGRLADIDMSSIEQVFIGAFSDRVSNDSRFLGGETFGSLSERVLACLREVLAEPSWKRLLLVAHGGVNRVILTHAMGAGLNGIGAMEQDPCCINIIDVDERGRFLIRLINHTPYNSAKHGLEMTTMERLFLDYRGKIARLEG